MLYKKQKNALKLIFILSLIVFSNFLSSEDISGGFGIDIDVIQPGENVLENNTINYSQVILPSDEDDSLLEQEREDDREEAENLELSTNNLGFPEDSIQENEKEIVLANSENNNLKRDQKDKLKLLLGTNAILCVALLSTIIVLNRNAEIK